MQDDEVVFLDDDEAADDEVWVGDERIQDERVEAGRGVADLPPHVSRHRLLVTLIVLAAVLGGAGTAFTVAYNRHVTDRRLASELKLAATKTLPQIDGLTALNSPSTWHARIAKRVTVPVVNRSPRPITLLDAVLTEPGMVTSAKLTPTGATTLEPGQTGSVTGEVGVDCTQNPAASFPLMDSSNNSDTPVAGTSTLQVRAKTESGRIGRATVNPDGYQPDIQQRICTQQGNNLLGAIQITSYADSAAHGTVSLNVSLPSNADVPMQYKTSLAFTDSAANPSGFCSSGPVTMATPSSGTVRPGGTAQLAFTIRLGNCPAGSSPAQTAYLELDIAISINGTGLDSTSDSTQLDSLFSERT